MSYPINYPTPQGANVQIFSQGGTTSDWVKPQGASFVWFTLIGAGGNGNGTSGGGSGAVTNFMCPAFLIPDVLRVIVASSGGVGAATQIRYQQKEGNGYQLLVVGSGSGATGGSAQTASAFAAMGFYQSIAGQNGAGGAITASSTTFLSGGGGNTDPQASNYGYTTSRAANVGGFFMLQPIIVGAGGMGSGSGGIGCGGGVTNGVGGDGLVVIITW